MKNEKINTKIKLSNDSTFVILIFEISKYRLFYISSFQVLNLTLRLHSNFFQNFDLKPIIFDEHFSSRGYNFCHQARTFNVRSQ